MARLGRRQSFKPILSGRIQYLPAPAVPGNVKRLVVSLAVKQSATAFRVQRPRVLLTGLIRYAAITAPALGSRGYMVSKQSLAAADRRRRVYKLRWIRSAVLPTVFPAVLRVSPGLTFVHEINDDNPRTRKALQQLSDTFNNLKRSGELSGTFAEPALGYVPENTMNWGGDEPGTVREALNRIAAALTAAGFTP